MPDHKHDNCTGRFALAWVRPLLLPFRILKCGIPIWLSYREPDSIVCDKCDMEYAYSAELWDEAAAENLVGAYGQVAANRGRRLIDNGEEED